MRMKKDVWQKCPEYVQKQIPAGSIYHRLNCPPGSSFYWIEGLSRKARAYYLGGFMTAMKCDWEYAMKHHDFIVNLETGEIMWTGNANERYTQKIEEEKNKGRKSA